MKAIATLALIGAAYGAQENQKGFLRGIDKQTLIKVSSKIAGLDENELYFGKLVSAVSEKAGEIKQETKNLGDKISQDAKNDKGVQNLGKVINTLNFEDHDLYDWVKLMDQAVKKADEVKQETKNLGEKTAQDIKNDQFIKNAEKMYHDLKALGLIDNDLYFEKLVSAVSQKAGEIKQETKNLGDKVSQDAKNDKGVQNLVKVVNALNMDDHDLFEFTKLLSAASNKATEVKQETKNLGDKVSQDVKNDKVVQNLQVIGKALGFDDHNLFGWTELMNEASKKVAEVKQETKNLGDKTAKDFKNDQFVKNAEKMYNDLKALGLIDNDLYFGKLVSAVSEKAGEIKQETKNLGDKISQDAKNDKGVQNLVKVANALNLEDHDLYTAQDLKNDQFIKNAEKMYNELKALGLVDKSAQDFKNEQFILNVVMMYNQLKAMGLVDNELLSFKDIASAVSGKASEIKQETKKLGDKVSQDAKNDSFVQNTGKLANALGFEDSSLFDLRKLLSDASKTVDNVKKNPKNFQW